MFARAHENFWNQNLRRLARPGRNGEAGAYALCLATAAVDGVSGIALTVWSANSVAKMEILSKSTIVISIRYVKRNVSRAERSDLSTNSMM